MVACSHDGIGDICDPFPTFAVHRLAHFDGFHGTLAATGTSLHEPPVRQPDGIYCRGKYGGDRPELWLERTVAKAAVNIGIDDLTPSDDDTVTLMLSAEQLATSPRCDGERAPVPPSQFVGHVVIPSSPGDAVMPYVSLATENTTVSFQAIAIYETVYP